MREDRKQDMKERKKHNERERERRCCREPKQKLKQQGMICNVDKGRQMKRLRMKTSRTRQERKQHNVRVKMLLRAEIENESKE